MRFVYGTVERGGRKFAYVGYFDFTVTIDESDMQYIENGIEPDVEVHISHEDKCNDKDIIFEKAIELLMQE